MGDTNFSSTVGRSKKVSGWNVEYEITGDVEQEELLNEVCCLQQQAETIIEAALRDIESRANKESMGHVQHLLASALHSIKQAEAVTQIAASTAPKRHQ